MDLNRTPDLDELARDRETVAKFLWERLVDITGAAVAERSLEGGAEDGRFVFAALDSDLAREACRDVIKATYAVKDDDVLEIRLLGEEPIAN